MNVIKRRSAEQLQHEQIARYRLDLRGTNLDGCDLSTGSFVGALLIRSRLEAANLNRCDLTGARMQGSLLNFAAFWDATLRGTNLDFCVISQHQTSGAFLRCNELSISVMGADLGAIPAFGENSRDVIGSKDTKLSYQLQERMDDLNELRTAHWQARRNEDAAQASGVESQIENHPMAHWFEYVSSDFAANWARQKFWEDHKISGWPFDD